MQLPARGLLQVFLGDQEPESDTRQKGWTQLPSRRASKYPRIILGSKDVTITPFFHMQNIFRAMEVVGTKKKFFIRL